MKIYSTSINHRPVFVSILEIILIIIMVFIGYRIFFGPRITKNTHYVVCTDELNGLVQYYEENGIGQIRIDYVVLYDNGYYGSDCYIEGIHSVSQANEAITTVIEYLKTNKQSLIDNGFIIELEMQGKESVTENKLYSHMFFYYDVSHNYTSTATVSTNSIINSLNDESFPMDFEKVSFFGTEELTEEELECLRQNYPDAEITSD